ncbi:MAG: tetratricopeptide repeat protein [Myxococcales bacterium]|nr:tetratricopeptide repeat protein [Myxococcales bacterium]MDP3504207.1 tetratricopeptide repeat protein [Myxococcales bacterium]
MILLSLTLAFTLGQKPDAEALKRTVALEAAAIEKSPDDTEALYRLGLAYLALGDAKRAIKPLEALVKADAESLDGKLLLARAYRGANDIQKAKELLDKAILAQPDEPTLRAERGGLARAQEETELAIEHYSKAVELAPTDANLRFNLAEAQQKSSRLDAAIAGYRKALELDSGLTSARVNLGKALAEKGLFGEAKEILVAVNKDTLDDAEAHYNLGVILMREGNASSAVKEFERTLAIAPKHSQALNNLGVAWDAMADTRKALEYFKKAGQADPTFAEAFFNQGMSLMKLNKPAEATKAFESALKLEPGSTAPYVQLGTLYLKQGKKDRAVEAFTKAIALADAQDKADSGFKALLKRNEMRRTTDAYRGLAMAYLELGKVDEAVNTLKLATDKMPKDASAREALGEAFLAQRNYDGAVEQFQKRLEVEPSVEARLDLARAYTKKRVAKQAEPLYRDVLKEDPTNRAAKLGLADLFTAQGRFADAEGVLKEMMAADPNDALALMRFGIMKSRMQRPNEALDPLEKAVEVNPTLLDARAELGFLLFRGDQGNAGRCVTIMNEILVTDDRHVLALYYRGVCLFSQDNKPKAEESFKNATRVDPSFGNAWLSLGELYEGLGNKDEAKKSYETAQKLDVPEAAQALKRLNK